MEERILHINNNHSFKIDVFDLGIFLDALATLKTMLLMTKNQSITNREAGLMRGDGGVHIYNNHSFKMGNIGSYFVVVFSLFHIDHFYKTIHHSNFAIVL